MLTDLGPWYYALAFPRWKPPDWLFGPVWTTIYALTAASFVVAWRCAPAGRRAPIAWMFLANAVLNVTWSGLFFAMKRPDLALVEVAILWASIVGMMLVVRPWSRVGWILLVPYLAWVTFASALNASIVMRNGPFG